MAGLCEGGNEPPGSLKARNNSMNVAFFTNTCPTVVGLYVKFVIELGENIWRMEIIKTWDLNNCLRNKRGRSVEDPSHPARWDYCTDSFFTIQLLSLVDPPVVGVPRSDGNSLQEKRRRKPSSCRSGQQRVESCVHRPPPPLNFFGHLRPITA
ncbi:hypothetical protein ANN_20824 [Periplaneta americana]|uniref:Uncharacterized protein n=1 Tax=Periplaneta americana TaxID=6978 RepID=A0ABQ8SDN8_PERAM|nr:hypothetical protein ANN_20824 [Periplaneta americana]